MLAKILEDMWVDPEVLEALSEEQKRILFFKMREEQVRRWKEREEREEREGRDSNETRQKKAFSKHVSWLLGRDGDVRVSVIGEVDEFRSSRILQNLTNNRVCSDNMNGIQTEDLLTGRVPQQLSFKEEEEEEEVEEEEEEVDEEEEEEEEEIISDDPPSTNSQLSEDDMDSCSADDNPKDPAEDSDSESGSNSDNHSDWSFLFRPHFGCHDNQPPLKALSNTERAVPQVRGDKTREEEGHDIVCWEDTNSKHGGRVAQLRKVFTDDPCSTPPACTKPAIPAKPAHLQKRSTLLIH